jgi:acetyltransferase
MQRSPRNAGRRVPSRKCRVMSAKPRPPRGLSSALGTRHSALLTVHDRYTSRVLIDHASEADLEALMALLQDSVHSGASIGFLPPLTDDAARDFWRKLLAEAAAGERVILVARDGAHIAGTVQLALVTKPNASHRAEVQKLLVLSSARGRGIGDALMARIEDDARQRGRSLLVLDTRKGDAASRLYARRGWQFAGEVPRYVRNEAGEYESTLIFYRDLQT